VKALRRIGYVIDHQRGSHIHYAHLPGFEKNWHHKKRLPANGQPLLSSDIH